MFFFCEKERQKNFSAFKGIKQDHLRWEEGMAFFLQEKNLNGTTEDCCLRHKSPNETLCTTIVNIKDKTKGFNKREGNDTKAEKHVSKKKPGKGLV